MTIMIPKEGYYMTKYMMNAFQLPTCLFLNHFMSINDVSKIKLVNLKACKLLN